MGRGGSGSRGERRRWPTGPHSPRPMALPVHDLGEGRLEPGLPDGRPQKVLRIDVTGAPPHLLGRLLVGSYITGQDQVLVSARPGLSLEKREEIRLATDKILGMSVVADSPTSVEVQIFIDPEKYELPKLLHRVVQMLRAELAVCRTALSGGDRSKLAVVEDIEEEVDRFYLLMVRQLLLSSDNPRIARNIDVESHHYQIGDRLVAKVLEVLGDLIHGIARDLEPNLPFLRTASPKVVRELERRAERLDRLLSRTMDAFGHLSLVEANAMLNILSELLPKDAGYGREIARDVPDPHAGAAAQRIACNFDMALEMLVIVNEVTINRSVEPAADLTHPERPHPKGRNPSLPHFSSETGIAILSEVPIRHAAAHS